MRLDSCVTKHGIYPHSMWLTKEIPDGFKALFDAKAEAA